MNKKHLISFLTASLSLAITSLAAPRPGTGKHVAGAHPYVALEKITTDNDALLKIGGMCFDGEDLYAVTFSPDRTNKQPDKAGRLLRIKGVTGSSATVEVLRDDLYEAAGVAVYNGSVYVGEKHRIIRFDNNTYTPGSEVVLIDGLSIINFHTYTVGFELLKKADGIHLCGNFTTTIQLGGKRQASMSPNPLVKRGSTFSLGPITGKEKPADLKLDYLAGGFRTPNGIEVGPDGAVYVADNQGVFNPANEVIRIKPGSFYGHFLEGKEKGGRPAAFQPSDVDSVAGSLAGQSPATVYLPQSSDVARSPTQPIVITGRTGVLAPYNGQLLVGDFTTGSMFRLALEEVRGVWQGVALRHSAGKADAKGNNGFYGGPNRIQLGPDGNYYIGSIGAGRLWQFGEDHGLQRLRVKKSAEVPSSFNEILTVQAVEGGLELTFLKPLKGSFSANDFAVEQWTYRPTQNYGGNKMLETSLEARVVEILEGGKRIRLTIDGLRDATDAYAVRNGKANTENVGYVVHVTFDPKDKTGEPMLYSGEFWYTMLRKLGGTDVALNLNTATADPAKQSVDSLMTSVCMTCHVERDGVQLAPEFSGMFKRKQTIVRDGKEQQIVVDRDYLVRAIKTPAFEHPKEFQPIMPELGLTDAQINGLVKKIMKMRAPKKK